MNNTEQQVQLHLDYLLSEGVVIKLENGNYRLKTENEIADELKDVENNCNSL